MAGKKSDSENSNENGLHKSKRGKAAASTTATNKTKGTNQRKKATRQTASSTSVAGTTSAAAAKDTPISSEGKARGKAEKQQKQLSFVVNLCPDCFMPHLEGDDCPTKVRPDTPGKVSIKPPAFLLKSADKECDNYQEGRFMKQQWL